MLHLVLTFLPVAIYLGILLVQAWRCDRRCRVAFKAGYATGKIDAQNSAPVIFSLN